MKKLGIFFASFLALGFVACEDESSLGVMQTNPQETVMSTDGLTVELGTDIADAAIDLATNVAANDLVNVISTKEIKDLPEGASVEYKMQLSTTADFAEYELFNVTNGAVSATEWDNWFRSNIGYAPDAKPNYIRFVAYVVEGAKEVRIGGANVYFAQQEVTVTPVAIPLETAYYLVGTATDWKVANAIAFKHSGKDVYEDPIFTLSVKIPEDCTEWWWKIVPASTYETGDWVSADYASYGPENGSEAMSGKLYGRTAESDCGAGCLKITGAISITIDMLNCTYEIAEGSPYLWTPGNSNGWNHANAQKLYTSDYTYYMGYAYLNGDFKFTDADNWDGTNYGASGTEGILSTDPTAGNLNSGSEGLFYCNVDIEGLTYALTPITTIGVIGDFNGWAEDVDLTPSADFLTWTGEVTLAAGGGWKFRANDGWDINLGGDMSNLSAGGDNIPAPGDGTYIITLNLATLPYTCTIEAK